MTGNNSYLYLVSTLTLLLANPIVAQAAEMLEQSSDAPVASSSSVEDLEALSAVQVSGVPDTSMSESDLPLATEPLPSAPYSPEAAAAALVVEPVISVELPDRTDNLNDEITHNADAIEVADEVADDESHHTESTSSVVQILPAQIEKASVETEREAIAAIETVSHPPISQLQDTSEEKALEQSSIDEHSEPVRPIDSIPEDTQAVITQIDEDLSDNIYTEYPQGSPQPVPRLYGELEENDFLEDDDFENEIDPNFSTELSLDDIDVSSSIAIHNLSTPENTVDEGSVLAQDVVVDQPHAVEQEKTEQPALIKGYAHIPSEFKPRLYGDVESELYSDIDLDISNSSADYLEHLSEDEWIALINSQYLDQADDQNADTENPYPESRPLAQVTSVDQLSDISPTDWSYQALRRLIEDYGILQGYPDNTFRGNNTVTRYEFASALRQVLDQIIESPHAQDSPSGIRESDLETLERLTQDFSDELDSIETRVDRLEAQTAELEANQFSPTARLSGRVTAGLAFADGGNPPGNGKTKPVFAHLTQLQIAGSFTGNDIFRIGLEASDFTNRGFADFDALDTNMALFGFQSNTNNSVIISSLDYRFPAFNDRVVFTVKPAGFGLTSVLTPNTIYTDAATGALSRFAAYNPYLRIGNLDAGLGLDALITDRTRLQIAYGVRNSSDASQGLLGSDSRALGIQLLAEPFDNVTTGIAYINAFSEDGELDTFTGSDAADTSGELGKPATIHAVTTSLQWDINENMNVGAWFGAAITDALNSDRNTVSTTYQLSLGFPNALGRTGDLLGFLVGQPPRLRSANGFGEKDSGSGLHYEVFYRHRINRYFTITPGIFYVSEPEHASSNNSIWAAAIRTTFQF